LAAVFCTKNLAIAPQNILSAQAPTMGTIQTVILHN